MDEPVTHEDIMNELRIMRKNLIGMIGDVEYTMSTVRRAMAMAQTPDVIETKTVDGQIRNYIRLVPLKTEGDSPAPGRVV